MKRNLLPLISLVLAACNSVRPVATATPVHLASADTRRADSAEYRVALEAPAYYAVLAVTPGWKIERLIPDSEAATPYLSAGAGIVAFPTPVPTPRYSRIDQVPRIAASTGYLDNPATSVGSPATLLVEWEEAPGAAPKPPSPTIVLVLLPTPSTAAALDQALPDPAEVSGVAGAVRRLGHALGMTTTPAWVVLNPYSPTIAR